MHKCKLYEYACIHTTHLCIDYCYHCAVRFSCATQPLKNTVQSWSGCSLLNRTLSEDPLLVPTTQRQ